MCIGESITSAMVAIFQPRANLFAVLAILATAGFLAGGIAWWWIWPRMDYLRHTDWTVEQPVPFSHQHHVAGLGHRLPVLSHGG